MTSSFFSSTLATVRTSAYAILLVLHLVLIVLAGTWYEPSRQGGDGIWAITVIMLMLFGSLSFITILLFLFILHRISSIHQLRFELIWLFLITATRAGLLAAFRSDYLNMTQSWGFCAPKEKNASCKKLKLVLAFVITNTAFTAACFLGTIAFGVVQQLRGREWVWSSPMVTSSASSDDLNKPVRVRSNVSDL